MQRHASNVKLRPRTKTPELIFPNTSHHCERLSDGVRTWMHACSMSLVDQRIIDAVTRLVVRLFPRTLILCSRRQGILEDSHRWVRGSLMPCPGTRLITQPFLTNSHPRHRAPSLRRMPGGIFFSYAQIRGDSPYPLSSSPNNP